jgi:hypothetical protein
METITLKKSSLIQTINGLGIDVNTWNTIHLSHSGAVLTTIYKQSLALLLATKMGSHTASEPTENAYIKFEKSNITIYLYL